MPVQFTPAEVEDYLYTFEAGVNAGVAPLLLQKNQLFTALNVTLRGTFAKPRPPVVKVTLDAPSMALLASGLASGHFQGGCFFKPDNADEGIMIAMGGRAFQITPDATAVNATVRERTSIANPASQPQAWMWQSEGWIIWNDGLSFPWFIDNVTTVQSNATAHSDFSTTTAGNFTIPAIGVAVAITLTSTANLLVGDVITILNRGQYIVNSIAGPVATCVNISSTPEGQLLVAPFDVTWQHIGPGIATGTQLPPGRQGAYVLGRNWMVLVDGKQFVASDLVGASSGTLAYNYRDAVLKITENNYLLGGGYFSVPGSLGDITFVKGMATPDVSLGQGPVVLGTHNTVFSCVAPNDRLTWQDVTNPILTESLIGNGGLGQYSTINVNSDLMMRSVDGFRSFIQARRDYNVWGNTPISREVDVTLSKDSPDLLPYGSSIYFDNRKLDTTRPILMDDGTVYHEGLVPTNYDPISSLRGKLPTIYDSTIWTGLNILQLFTGEFQGIERAFALTIDITQTPAVVELWQIMKSATTEIYDNGTERITWGFETSVLFNQGGAKSRQMLRLVDGEISVDDLQGKVDFQVYYKPDQYPCWTPWFSWQECAGVDSDLSKPQFRPIMGLGQPSSSPCDASTGRPMREGFGFQVKVIVTGHCRILGIRARAITIPLPAFAKQVCTPICVPAYVPGGEQ